MFLAQAQNEGSSAPSCRYALAEPFRQFFGWEAFERHEVFLYAASLALTKISRQICLPKDAGMPEIFLLIYNTAKMLNVTRALC